MEIFFVDEPLVENKLKDGRKNLMEKAIVFMNEEFVSRFKATRLFYGHICLCLEIFQHNIQVYFLLSPHHYSLHSCLECCLNFCSKFEAMQTVNLNHSSE